VKAAICQIDGVSIEDVEVPQPKNSEVLVKVHASSLNRADMLRIDRHGGHSAPDGGVGSRVGMEFAGEVVEVGSEVDGHKAGDRVMCSGAGGFAEYAVADHRRALPIPDEITDFEQAACLTAALVTNYASFIDVGEFKAGDSVVVLGASSAVGLMSLQCARELGAGLVIGTSTKEDRRRRLVDEFGADYALDSRDPGWAQHAAELTGGAGVDILIDFLSGPHINESMRAVRIGGRIVNVGRLAGDTGNFDFDLHSMRRTRYLGQTFRTRGEADAARISRGTVETFWPALAAGRLALPIDHRFPLAEIAEAVAVMRSNAHFGKIVVTMAD
jgi:NADPH2:quinone reductase